MSWNAPFTITARLSVTCDFCPEPPPERSTAVVWEGEIQAGDRLTEGRLPVGWRSLNGQPMCPGHSLVIDKVAR